MTALIEKVKEIDKNLKTLERLDDVLETTITERCTKRRMERKDKEEIRQMELENLKRTLIKYHHGYEKQKKVISSTFEKVKQMEAEIAEKKKRLETAATLEQKLNEYIKEANDIRKQREEVMALTQKLVERSVSERDAVEQEKKRLADEQNQSNEYNARREKAVKDQKELTEAIDKERGETDSLREEGRRVSADIKGKKGEKSRAESTVRQTERIVKEKERELVRDTNENEALTRELSAMKEAVTAKQKEAEEQREDHQRQLEDLKKNIPTCDNKNNELKHMENDLMELQKKGKCHDETLSAGRTRQAQLQEERDRMRKVIENDKEMEVTSLSKDEAWGNNDLVRVKLQEVNKGLLVDRKLSDEYIDNLIRVIDQQPLKEINLTETEQQVEQQLADNPEYINELIKNTDCSGGDYAALFQSQKDELLNAIETEKIAVESDEVAQLREKQQMLKRENELLETELLQSQPSLEQKRNEVDTLRKQVGDVRSMVDSQQKNTVESIKKLSESLGLDEGSKMEDIFEYLKEKQRQIDVLRRRISELGQPEEQSKSE